MSRAMKDSGVEWIGEIPEGWTIRKMESIADTITDYVASGSFASLNENVEYLNEPDYAMLIRTVDLSNKSNQKHVYINKNAYDFLANSNLHGGELILSNIGSVGNVYMYEPMYKNASLAPNSIMILMKDNTRYYYYWFLNPYGNESLKNIGSNSVQLKFNKTQLRQLLVPRPSLEEQNSIVSFLDKKVSQIENIIQKQNEVIENLKTYKQSLITETVTKGLNPNAKMKDSGVDWIGEVPELWNLTKIKYMFEIKKVLIFEEDRDILSVTQNGVKIKDISNNEGQIARSYAGYQEVEINDFVMNHMDLLTGYVDCSKFNGVTSPDYRVFKILDDKNNDRNYYLRIFQMCYKNKIFYGLGQGVSNLGRWRLQTDKFINFILPVPTLTEQQQIANFLDKKCKVIDNTIIQKEELIEKLEIYKKSLIYEYVTGKREVK